MNDSLVLFIVPFPTLSSPLDATIKAPSFISFRATLRDRLHSSASSIHGSLVPHHRTLSDSSSPYRTCPVHSKRRHNAIDFIRSNSSKPMDQHQQWLQALSCPYCTSHDTHLLRFSRRAPTVNRRIDQSIDIDKLLRAVELLLLLSRTGNSMKPRSTRATEPRATELKYSHRAKSLNALDAPIALPTTRTSGAKYKK
jgi:hypothetical protein